MSEKWREVPGFPNYEVSSDGVFVNAKTERILRVSSNQRGHAKVSLYRGRELITRSAAVLVAEAFIPQPNPRFDVVIHLDGDLGNCSVSNLMWRPRWFAIKYHRQFHLDNFHTGYAEPQTIIELGSGKEYRSIKEVCMTEGLYYFDVHQSCIEETMVPVTFQEFRYA